MTKKEINPKQLPGIRLKDRGLFVAFTYRCSNKPELGGCPEESNCSHIFHLGEHPVTIRGELAGTNRCSLMTDKYWGGVNALSVPAESPAKNLLQKVLNRFNLA